jgi:5-methyltetrahydropteroyltriglutamate--homocysteine methyltransferase
LGAPSTAALRPTCTGAIAYTAQQFLRDQLVNLKLAANAAGVEEGFVSAIAPGSLEMFCRDQNSYYPSTEKFLEAIGDAMRVEILNHALEGIPTDRVRYHICWGSWHGPHTTDFPLRDIVDVMLRVNAQAYLMEAGNVRHEHEFKVWRDVKLPGGKILIPGVVSHATDLVEHPELVADRILAFADIVGRENVIAGTDCGLGGRVHPQIAWAKLRALRDGAAIASKKLWS